MSSSAELKLFYHLSEKILSQEIKTFADLVKYTQAIKLNFDPEKVLLKAFTLIRQLRWGFFKEMDRSGYPKLWRELVIPHQNFREAGDLKRSISISNIYISMLDIHGYTRFCQESKSNLSRLRKLDEFMHEGIRRIASSNQAIANRERGDEIVLVAATATDSIKTTLEIINTFSKRSVLKSQSVQRDRSEYSVVLPEFKVTAGITGGNLSTPLIITESGLLSGFLLNTAARLQSLANELSPTESKIIATQSVYSSYLKENKVVKSDLYQKKLIQFFNNGPVAFKGVAITSYEIIFDKKEGYRLKYSGCLDQLFDSLRQQLWRQKIFSDLMTLIREVCRYTTPFLVEISGDKGPEAVTNPSITQLCDLASQKYAVEEDYISALSLLGKIREQLSQVDSFDRLVMKLLDEIYLKYEQLRRDYEDYLEQEIDKKLDYIFNGQGKTAYFSARKNAETYEKLRAYARQSRELGNKKNIWYWLIEKKREALALQIYSGKR